MPRPRAHPPDVRRKMIVDAARKVMSREGYDAVRLDEVAHLASAAKGTLYLYFKNKMALLAGVYEDVLDDIDLRLASVPDEGDALKRLSGMVRETLKQMDEEWGFFSKFVGGHPDLFRASVGEGIKKRYGAHVDLVASRLKACVRQGTLRRHDPLMGAQYYDNLIHLFVNSREMGLDKRPLAGRHRDFMGLLLRGLGGKR
ncbi:TetR/AcrR family transcriptional regulator [Elusimicrobiota bacterium]